MTGDVSTAVEVSFHFTDEYEQLLLESGPDSWIGVSISVGGDPLYGDERTEVRGFACSVALALLDSVAAVARGDHALVEFESGPSWLAVEPESAESVALTKCRTHQAARNPEKRTEVDVTRYATQEAWFRAVVDAAREFQKRVTTLYPDLREAAPMIELRKRVEEVEALASSDGA